MTLEYTGRGDPRRSMALLWGIPRKRTRGPKPGLSVDDIVRAGIELADAQGLDAVSMRRVAERLGVGTMSLYTYIRTKAELLDVMVDAVYREHVETLEAANAKLDPTLPPRRRWRPALESFARAGWDLHLRHPWMLHVASARAVLGPNETMVLDLALRTVDGLGLSGREMVGVVDLMGTYVRGAVRSAAESLEAPQVTGKTDTEWWREREPLLDEMLTFSADRFPNVFRVSADGGFDVTGEHEYTVQFAIDDFELGLPLVLDGIAALVEARRRRKK